MKRDGLGRAAMMTAAAALVLGTAGCDRGQEAREIEAHNAKVEKEEADAKVQRQANFSIECISAVRWKSDFLAGAGAGTADLYTKHYRGLLEKTLGDSMIPAPDGAPELSKGSIDPYLAWAYDNDVKTKFTVGRDSNGDGTISPAERDAQGNSRIAACVQQAAESGVGPYAGKDKTARMFKMKAFSDRLAKASK